MSYICEKCGKIVETKFGSGRFCSRSCANSRIQTDEINEKRRMKAGIHQPRYIQAKKKYLDNPRICRFCGNTIPYEFRKRVFCSDECENKVKSIEAKQKHLGGITKGHGSGIAGKYKNIKCDSKYELAYLIYCLENNINIVRNKKSFTYMYPNKGYRKYYPDFYLPDSETYVEIKGYYQESTKYKVQAMKYANVNFKILYWDDLKICFEYIRDKFNRAYNTLEKLYDK